MAVRGIFGWFQNFRMQKTITQPVKRELLEEIVALPIEPTKAEESKMEYPLVRDITTEVAEPKIELPLYGEALRRHFGYPDWFYNSQKELKKLGVHGEAQVAGARVSTPEQIRHIYFRLERIFEYDTRSFVTYAPSVFTYKNSYLENYLGKLREVGDLLREKFSYTVPAEFDWRKNPAFYLDIGGIVQLEARLRNLEKDKNANQVVQKLEAYAGKRILLLGIRTKRQQEIIKSCLPNSTIPTFHNGEDIKGIASQNIGRYDVFVLTPGIATHKVQQRLEALYGAGFKDVSISVQAINPGRILEVMSQNSYRFK